MLLGLGTGESLNEVPATGMEWPDFRERFARFREAIELIRRLWSEERVSFDGEYYQTRQATIYDAPPGGLPLYVAAGGPQMARYAGRVGDGLICTSGKGDALYREQLLPAFAEGARKAGRDPDRLDRLIEVKVSFDPDPERALADTRHWGALALSAEEKTGVEDPMEMERLADALPVERAASRWIVSSDPEEHAAKVLEYVELGFTHLVFHAPGPDQRRFLDLYAEQILPRLRRRLASRLQARGAGALQAGAVQGDVGDAAPAPAAGLRELGPARLVQPLVLADDPLHPPAAVLVLHQGPPAQGLEAQRVAGDDPLRGLGARRCPARGVATSSTRRRTGSGPNAWQS